MIELPESHVIAAQLNETIKGKIIQNVTANASPHKFAWYFGDPNNYHALLSGKKIDHVLNHGGLVEILAEDARILFGDGANARFFDAGEPLPKKHQLHIEFDDFTSIICSVQMYGGMWAFLDGTNDNPYYLGSKNKTSPLTDDFDEPYFVSLLNDKTKRMSAKAFLATEQRIPGLGNGVLQDILFHAGIHPKHKMEQLSDVEIKKLYTAIKTTLFEMTSKGGRDTEKDLFGVSGGYQTILSKNTVEKPCPVCGTIIKKEAYMGGSIYYCGGCQKS